MLGSATLLHYFEGSYNGGIGLTVHQEYENVIDQSTTGINGGYAFFSSASRRVDNTDNGNPENQSSGVPGSGAEWCFKIHGHTKAVTSASGVDWGPFSHRYCIARSGSGAGVFVTSDRNVGKANFRVWNFTGATITNVQLRTQPSPGTMICGFGNIVNNAVSSTCAANIAGPSTLDIWYNGTWVPLDAIDFDGN